MDKLSDYKHALDESSIVAITDHRGIIVYVNEKFCDISKYTSDELIGQDHRIVNSGHHPKAFFKQLWSTISQGKVWKGVIKNKAKDGSIYWVDTTIVPFLNDNNKPYQYVAIRTDVTLRVEREQKLIRTLKEVSDYRYALDESVIVAITDANGLITYVNDNFCKTSKYTRKELIGQDHRIINSGYHSKKFIKKLWTTIINGEVWKGEFLNIAKNGVKYWMDTTIVPFLDEEGKPYQYVAIRSDITERKKAEEQLRNSNERALNHARLMELQNAQLVDFCNIVSHNLRAPLTNISMLVDFIEQVPDEAERWEILGKIKPVVNHLMEVFDELVESIQVKEDTEIRLDQVVLKDCLEKILIGFETQIEEYGAVIQSNFDKVDTIYFPDKYMESIMTNLISNALKYKSPLRKPVIQLKTTKGANNSTLLSFGDNGLGINLQLHKDYMFKIRKTFHKHPDARGFGLFMTKTQVDAMGGKIWVESEVDVGTTIFIEFKNQD